MIINNTNVSEAVYSGNVQENKVGIDKENIDFITKNYNNFNEIFNFRNIIKYSSNKNKPINKIKYPVEESKSVLYYKDNSFNKMKKTDKKCILDNIIEEYNNNSLFKQIKILWESIGGVTPE